MIPHIFMVCLNDPRRIRVCYHDPFQNTPVNGEDIYVILTLDNTGPRASLTVCSGRSFYVPGLLEEGKEVTATHLQTRYLRPHEALKFIDDLRQANPY